MSLALRMKGGLAAMLLGACAPEPPACVVQTHDAVEHRAGQVPVVITSTHGGTRTPRCEDPSASLARRSCAGTDMCASGPCRIYGDSRVADLVRALDAALTKCLGGAPAVVTMEVDRAFLDVNRDVEDEAGLTCAMTDPRARPLWDAFHETVAEAVWSATLLAPGRALLLDVHTYRAIDEAPPPAVMLGAGVPFGATLPHLREDDPALDRVFGADGLRARIVAALDRQLGLPLARLARVEPQAADVDLGGLFAGRAVTHRYAQPAAGHDGTPAIDALQIEVSEVLREEPKATADSIAGSLCGALGDRLSPR